MEDDDGDDDRPLPLSSLMSIWKDEQNRIASRVVVPPDRSKTSSMSSSLESDIERGDSGRFKLVHPTFTSSSASANNAAAIDETNDGTLLVGGVDVHCHDDDDDDDDDVAVAVYVILEYDLASCDHRRSRAPPPHRVVHRSHKWYRPAVPYVPSYLAYREMDPLIELINDHKQSNHLAERQLVPSVIFVDGNGMWHERNAGLACFVGVMTGLPTVGVGKAFYGIDGTMTRQDVQARVIDALYSWYGEMTRANGRHRNDERISVGALSDEMDRCLVLDAATITATSTPPATAFVGEKGRESKRGGGDVVPVERPLEMLHRYARGIAIPMKWGRAINTNDCDGTNNNNNDSEGGRNDDQDEPLAYALVGHGGNDITRASKISSQDSFTPGARRGSINPIYISVGSNISLLDAVNLCSSLCLTRIPGPIREADMYCRRLVRERQSAVQMRLFRQRG